MDKEYSKELIQDGREALGLKEMKAEICSDCGGSGQWECDERGAMYAHPEQCTECNGSGARIRLEDNTLKQMH